MHFGLIQQGYFYMLDSTARKKKSLDLYHLGTVQSHTIHPNYDVILTLENTVLFYEPQASNSSAFSNF